MSTDLLQLACFCCINRSYITIDNEYDSEESFNEIQAPYTHSLWEETGVPRQNPGRALTNSSQLCSYKVRTYRTSFLSESTSGALPVLRVPPVPQVPVEPPPGAANLRVGDLLDIALYDKRPRQNWLQGC